MMLKPILSDREFVLQHEHVDGLIKKLITTKSGRGKLSGEIIEETRHRSSKFLPANNSRARLLFARALADQIASCVDADKPLQGSMVTVAPGDCTLPLQKAREFHLDGLVTQVEKIMPTESFVGVIEAAFYPRSQLFTEPMVSWHAHCLTWCENRQKLENRVARANTLGRSAINGLEPFHVRFLDHKALCKRAHYISKGQVRQYNAYRKRAHTIGWDDEEENDNFKVFSQKTSIRAGNAVKMMQVMFGRTLHDLSIAGEDGKFVL